MESEEKVLAITLANAEARRARETHCRRDPSVIGCCAGPGQCSCECNTCLCPLCMTNPCVCSPGTFNTD